MIAVDIHIDKQADERAGAHKACPVPLPASADREESFRSGEIGLAVFCEDGNVEDERDAIHDGQRDAGVASHADALRRMVARRRVEKRSVGEELNGRIRLKGEIAVGAVGYGAIAVVGVVEMVQRLERKVDAVKDGFVLSVSCVWPRQQLSGAELVEAGHLVWVPSLRNVAREKRSR